MLDQKNLQDLVLYHVASIAKLKVDLAKATRRIEQVEQQSSQRVADAAINAGQRKFTDNNRPRLCLVK